MALAKMEDIRGLVKISAMSIGGSDDREHNRNIGVLSLSDPSVFRVPSEPASKRQRGAMALLEEQLAVQQMQSREQKALLER